MYGNVANFTNMMAKNLSFFRNTLISFRIKFNLFCISWSSAEASFSKQICLAENKTKVEPGLRYYAILSVLCYASFLLDS